MVYLLGMIPFFIFLLLFSFIGKYSFKKNYKTIIIFSILGCIGSYFSYRVEMHIGSYFKKVIYSNYFEILFYAIFGVAIVEEGYKWIVSLFSNKIFHVDYISSTFLISLSFAVYENIVFYMIPYGVRSIIQRTFTAIFSHLCNSYWMGVLFEKSFNKNNKLKYLYLLLSLLLPVFFHGLYNSFLYGNKYVNYFYYFYVFYLIITLILFIRRKYVRKN